MSKADKARTVSYLARAQAQVEAAQEAASAGDLLQAAACVREASALQQEAVALLLAGCWQNTLCRARDEDPRRREEVLSDLVQLAGAILGDLCQECRRKMSVQLQIDEKQ